MNKELKIVSSYEKDLIKFIKNRRIYKIWIRNRKTRNFK